MSPKITGLTITDNSITIDYTPDPPPIIYDKLNVGGYWGVLDRQLIVFLL
jgi:hypothetical protein